MTHIHDRNGQAKLRVSRIPEVVPNEADVGIEKPMGIHRLMVCRAPIQHKPHVSLQAGRARVYFSTGKQARRVRFTKAARSRTI